MNGFALVACGLSDMADLRLWIEDEKTALYRAHDAMLVWPIVLVHNARAVGSTVSDGGAPVFKANLDKVLIDKLS